MVIISEFLPLCNLCFLPKKHGAHKPSLWNELITCVLTAWNVTKQ